MELGWTGRAVAIAGLLTVGVMVIPTPTSLGQGISEVIITGWQGQYIPANHKFRLRILYGNGSSYSFPMASLPLKDFSRHQSKFSWLTPNNYVPALKAAYTQSRSALDQQLGTNNNVATMFSPFPGNPVAYSAGFMRVLAQKHINPAQFGGPNIPPHAVPLSKMKLLQIDTKADNNTLIQLVPGQTPPALRALNHSLPIKQNG